MGAALGAAMRDWPRGSIRGSAAGGGAHIREAFPDATVSVNIFPEIKALSTGFAVLIRLPPVVRGDAI